MFPTKRKQEIRLQGQGSGGYLSHSLGPEGWTIASHMSRTCFERTWYQRVQVFLVCNKGKEAGLSTLEVGAILQEHGLSPTSLLGTSPSGDGCVSVWREAGAMLSSPPVWYLSPLVV